MRKVSGVSSPGDSMMPGRTPRRARRRRLVGRAVAMVEPTPESANELTDPRVAALLPAELLDPDEIIILLIKPSPWYILLTSLGTLGVVALGVIATIMLDRAGVLPILRRDAILFLTAIAGLRLFWQFLEWLSRVYVLTDRRVIRVKGVVRVHVFEAALKRIQHTNTYFSLAERLLGLGSIGFFTAGTGQAEAYWLMLTDPLTIHQTLVKTLRRYR